MTGLMRSLSAHVETWRPYTSCYVGLVGLAGAALAADSTSGARLFAAWAIPTLGWLAGLYGGDYFDRELDAIAKPQRPIPSGRLRASTALAAMIGLIAAGAAWTLLLNWHAVALVGLATVVGVSYNAFFKARGLSGNLVRGSLTSFAFLFGVLLGGGHIGPELIAVSAVFCFHDSASNLVGTLRDMDGDKEGGYLTLPVRRGVRTTVRVITGLAAVWTVLAATAPLFLHRPVNAGWVMLLTAAVGAFWTVVVLLLRAGVPSRRYALHLHEVICLERVVLAGALIAWGAGVVPAAATVLPALLITWTAQRILRSRHEFGRHGQAADAGPSVVPMNLREYS